MESNYTARVPRIFSDASVTIGQWRRTLECNEYLHLGEERPENPENFHRNPSRGCIESIKSAGERSQKVGLIIICLRNFLETRISRRFYIPKNAILHVNLL